MSLRGRQAEAIPVKEIAPLSLAMTAIDKK